MLFELQWNNINSVQVWNFCGMLKKPKSILSALRIKLVAQAGILNTPIMQWMK